MEFLYWFFQTCWGGVDQVNELVGDDMFVGQRRMPVARAKADPSMGRKRILFRPLPHQHSLLDPLID